jgi:hypothetical protein
MKPTNEAGLQIPERERIAVSLSRQVLFMLEGMSPVDGVVVMSLALGMWLSYHRTTPDEMGDITPIIAKIVGDTAARLGGRK